MGLASKNGCKTKINELINEDFRLLKNKIKLMSITQNKVLHLNKGFQCYKSRKAHSNKILNLRGFKKN